MDTLADFVTREILEIGQNHCPCPVHGATCRNLLLRLLRANFDSVWNYIPFELIILKYKLLLERLTADKLAHVEHYAHDQSQSTFHL